MFFFLVLMVPSPNIRINLPRTNEKLYCIGEPFRFSSSRFFGSKRHTDRLITIPLLLLYMFNFSDEIIGVTLDMTGYYSHIASFLVEVN